MFTEYNSRLARVLDSDSELQLNSNLNLIPDDWPTRKGLYQSSAAPTISVIELLALPDCGLKYLISQRNEILAKHMNTAAQLHYEMDMIVALKRCLNEYQDKMSAADVTVLTTMKLQKQKEIITHYLNLLFTEPETHLALKPIAKTVAGRSHQLEQDVIDAFAYFKELSLLVSQLQQGGSISFDQSLHYSLEQTQHALSLLYNNRYFSQLVFSMQFAKSQLQQATSQLKAVSKEDQCRRFSQEKLTILKNVLMLFYIKQQQPYLVDLIQSYQQMQTAVMGSLPSHANLNASQSQVISYYRSGLDIELKKASQAHAHAWQKLLQQCNIKAQSLVSTQ